MMTTTFENATLQIARAEALIAQIEETVNELKAYIIASAPDNSHANIRPAKRRIQHVIHSDDDLEDNMIIDEIRCGPQKDKKNVMMEEEGLTDSRKQNTLTISGMPRSLSYSQTFSHHAYVHV